MADQTIEELLRRLKMEQAAQDNYGEQNSSFEDPLLYGLSGIKKTKKQKRISRFNWNDALLENSECNKSFVPGEGIVEVSSETEIILDCGHSSKFDIGHVADCGHIVCKFCLVNYVLICAAPACFAKLCTVQDCSNSAKAISGVFYCGKHSFSAQITDFFSRIFSSSQRNQVRIEEKRQNYYLINSLIRPPEERKAITYEK